MEFFSLLSFASLLLAPALAAPPPAASLTGGDIANARLNITLLSPTTLDSSLSTVKDPWDMPILYTPWILEWYGYRAPLPYQDAALVVRQAMIETTDRLMGGDDHIPLGPHPYSYSHGAVHLWFQVAPGVNLAWGRWARIVDLIPFYGEHNSWRGAQFVVFVPGSGGSVVTGHLLAEG